MSEQPAKDYAPIFLNGGGYPDFRQINAYLEVHFNAHAEYNEAAAPDPEAVRLREALIEARREIEAEISMASDPEGKDQFEKGSLAAYHFALSVLPDAALAASPEPAEGLDE